MAVSFGQWTLGLDGDEPPQRELIGGKAWSVARMQALGLSTPPAFVVTTAACRADVPSDRGVTERGRAGILTMVSLIFSINEKFGVSTDHLGDVLLNCRTVGDLISATERLQQECV